MKKKRFYIKPQSEALAVEVGRPLAISGMEMDDSTDNEGNDVMICDEDDFA